MEGSARVGSRMGAMEALPLPPPPRLAAVSSPSPAASIRAHLARAAGAGGGVESCQSPRSLLSRILQRGGDGGGGGGGKFGCRVRLPRRYSSTSAAGAGAEAKDTASEQDAPARVKVVGRAPDLSLDTPRSSCTLDEGRNGKKKQEEEIMSMNLGLGASLVLLLSKGAVELNKMVELRAQMEALVSEIRKETQSKHKDSAAAATAAARSSSQESDGRSTTAVKDPIARAAVSDDAMSNCSGGGGGSGGRAAVVMHRMEAELQVELSRLQCGSVAAAHGEKRGAPPTMHGLEVKTTTKSNVSDSPPRSCVVDDDDDVAEGGNGGEVVEEDDDDDEEDEEYDEEGEEEEEEEYGGGGGGDKSPPHGGVSARALERRLYELLQKRQQERIVELEAALDATQRRLHEKEREVVWWRDAAKLVTHRRDESRRFARS
ncbi:hypothetical protein OsJ_20366 [Oryza sativa Japonica Group]|uniref:Uncharacterized protein n=2 Tax=Oryza sativa subsp. japonica TaxID=39947 RepID=B9FRV9_ORYSJ|nr:hypothetical protein OsJ_20366 [Oryza sativa Japonica Group]